MTSSRKSDVILKSGTDDKPDSILDLSICLVIKIKFSAVLSATGCRKVLGDKKIIIDLFRVKLPLWIQSPQLMCA